MRCAVCTRPSATKSSAAVSTGKWHIDARALMHRLGGLSRAEEAALVEIVEFRLGRGRGI